MSNQKVKTILFYNSFLDSKKNNKIFSLRDEIQKRKFESESSETFESLNFDDFDKLDNKRRDSLNLNSEFKILQRKKTIEVDF